MKDETGEGFENRKLEQLKRFTEKSDGQALTTDQGVKISHTDDSLKAGDRGPTLIEDFHFREKLTHFDHEPIPERVVHARGSGAHGYFQVYESMAEYTKAAFLQDPSKRTPTFVRFSQVVGSKGSADTVRDVRGFATKFYTEEGNYDLVGNDMPIFFIQDAIKFPDLVHAIKPEPHNEIPQASAAHDNFWDFISLMPESIHMILWLLSDRGIVRSYRMMEGFGVNTFRFVNASGDARFVKFHWKPMLGTHSLVWDEAQKIAGKDPDFLRRDLWEAIEAGDYPEYEFGVQMIEEEDEFAYDFDVLDPTKFWPEEEVPVRIIGKMVLNRNPDNFFAETEQVAFHPGNLVPGIDVSNDPLLQGRLFSYLDTQIIRLGGPNFTEIPINRPVAEVHNNQRDAYHRQTINKGRVNYFPNSLNPGSPAPVPPEEGGYAHYQERVEGGKIRARSESFKDFYGQAKLFWNSLSGPERKRLVEAAHFELGKVESEDVRRRMVGLLDEVDGELASAVARGIGAKPPPEGGGVDHSKSSPAVSMENTVKTDIKSRRVAILVADGVRAVDVEMMKEALTEAGARCRVIAMYDGIVTSAEGEEISVDSNYVSTASVLFDALFIPGGKEAVEALKKQGDALHFANETFKHFKPIAALGDGIALLEASNIKGMRLSTRDHPGEVVSDAGVVTMYERRRLSDFVTAFRKAIAGHRHWNRVARDLVPA